MIISFTYAQYKLRRIAIPIVKNIIKFGHSRAVILPRGWVRYAEKEQGRELRSVALEVNGIIKISPYFDKMSETKERGNEPEIRS